MIGGLLLFVHTAFLAKLLGDHCYSCQPPPMLLLLVATHNSQLWDI